MSSQGELYFVAIVPPEPIRTEVQAFKHIAAELFNSRRALRSPAHITLLPPFRVPKQELVRCHHALIQVGQKAGVFKLTLSGFDAFKPRVIFVDVTMTPALAHLQEICFRELGSTLGLTPPSRPFHAHMTVAFKDLRRNQFGPAWEYFSSLEYERTFNVQHIVLLRHTSSGWVEYEQYGLRPVG